MMVADRLSIDTLILTGGAGARLRCVVSDRPKPMADVAGRPFLEWLLLRLRSQGLRRVIFCTGHKAEAVRAHFGNGSDWDMDAAYSQEPSPLGTAGAVRHAVEHVRTDPFFVLNGDSYCPADFHRMCEHHRQCRARATLWLVSMDDCRRYGSVETDDHGQVLAFKEKSETPEPGLINAGIYLLQREVAESIPVGRPVSIERDVFPGLIGDGLYGVAGEGPFLDIGTPEAYARAEDFIDWQSLTP